MKESPNGTSRMERVALACTSIGFLFLSGGVTTGILYLLLTMASLVLARPATAQSTPVAAGVRLEAGIEKEDVDGDLKSAMDIYQKIAADTSAPRDVRAKALLRLAGCDEKLGRQAKQVYEQIVHDYADQPAAAQARNRLALLKKQENPAIPTTMSVRKIEWAGLGEMSPCDTDGHRAVYRAADGNLYFGDLTGQNKHLVFKVQPGDVPVWCAVAGLIHGCVCIPAQRPIGRPSLLWSRPTAQAIASWFRMTRREPSSVAAAAPVLTGPGTLAICWFRPDCRMEGGMRSSSTWPTAITANWSTLKAENTGARYFPRTVIPLLTQLCRARDQA